MPAGRIWLPPDPPARLTSQPESVSQKVPVSLRDGESRAARRGRAKANGSFRARTERGVAPSSLWAPAQFLHQVRGGLEAAAENQSDRWLVRLGGQGIEPGQNALPRQPFAETALGGAIAFGEGAGVGIAEEVEDIGAQARPARGLRQGAPGLGGDEKCVTLGRTPFG